jgi:pilus assembly protein Flp/PilA
MVSKLLKDIFDDTAGATAIEYGLIVALVGLVILASVRAVAGETIELWTKVDTEVTDAIGNGPKTPPVD